VSSGEEVLKLAERHVGEVYRNVLVPKDNASWRGPWDCAELASWCVYQAGGFLYGCTDNAGDPATTEAYTGAWRRDARELGRMVGVFVAAATPGAFLLRYPPGPGRMGHIAICDGTGGTVEAHSATRGVIRSRAAGRRWDTGVLVAGLDYTEGDPIGIAPPRVVIYRLTTPHMKGSVVRAIQRALKENGVSPGPIDGDFGPQTQAAVAAFQALRRLVVDGEVGPQTARALGVELPRA
jgi:hypothetical protein